MRLPVFVRTAPGMQALLYVVWFHAMFAMACWAAVFYEVMACNLIIMI
jgi:hypothetical protein